MEGAKKLCCNNKSTINVTRDQIQYDHIKHAGMNWHFIKEKLDSRLIYTHISIDGLLFNILINGLSSHSF